MSSSAQPGQLELGAPASPTSGHEEETAPRGVTPGLGMAEGSWAQEKAAGHGRGQLGTAEGSRAQQKGAGHSRGQLGTAEGSWTSRGWARPWTRLALCSDRRSLQTSGILHEL